MNQHFIHFVFIVLVISFAVSRHLSAQVVPSPFDLGFQSEQSVRVNWPSSNNRYYDLWTSIDLKIWTPVDGFPKVGTNTLMEEYFQVRDQHFFRMASAPDLTSYIYPEVAAYKASTGITLEAAIEINTFLRNLRGAGVEPALFWVGGSRYNSVNGSTVRAVIGGTGTVSGSLGTRGDRFETFSGNQILRFPNPLKNASQSRVGFFAGASPDTETYSRGLISGGESNPIGPILGANWGGGDFRVFNSAGEILPHNGFGGFARAGSFLPYVGGAHDGFFSVLCGIGKSAGSRENPLRYFGLPTPQFSNNQFVNSQNFIDLGAPRFSGKLHFAVVTAADLTDNQRAYEIISIPRRVGFGSYGIQTSVVFLGDSITVGYSGSVTNSDGLAIPNKGGGQWNRNSLGLLVNATGEGNVAQIEYFNKAAKYALDTRTWDHLFFVCGAGGHYINGEHTTQNPLSSEAKESIDNHIQDYHQNIAVAAAELGASVVQMIYIYGCPQKGSSVNPEIWRAFSEYRAQKQLAIAHAAGFPIFDVYHIPQLHAPLEAFYNDVIHPNEAGNRLIAQEFAASVANPTSRAPRSLNRPQLIGTPSLTNTLSIAKGSWAFTPSHFSYQWMRDATDITGAVSSFYTVSSADVGFYISCRVTAHNAYGSAERTSAHTTLIAN